MSKRTKFGDAVETLRLNKNLTLSALAKLMQVQPSYLSMIENGRTPLNERALEGYVEHLAGSVAEEQFIRSVAENFEVVRSIKIPSHQRERIYLADRLLAKFSSMSHTEILEIIHYKLNDPPQCEDNDNALEKREVA